VRLRSKSALLLGATGLVGGHCLDLLLSDDNYNRVVVPTRRALTIKNKKMEQLLVNFDRLEESANLLKADDIYCCLGTTMKKAGSKDAFYKVDFTYPHEIAKLTLKNGAERFLIVSSVGASSKSSNFYLKVKGEIEEAISKLPFAAVHIFRPSLLLGERDEQRLGEKVGMVSSRALSFLFIGGLKKYRPIEARVVASAMVEAAQKSSSGISVYESDEVQSMYDRNKR
jgi:uncharacterized protein YbjT (DUF2867 family)